MPKITMTLNVTIVDQGEDESPLVYFNHPELDGDLILYTMRGQCPEEEVRKLGVTQDSITVETPKQPVFEAKPASDEHRIKSVEDLASHTNKFFSTLHSLKSKFGKES